MDRKEPKWRGPGWWTAFNPLYWGDVAWRAELILPLLTFIFALLSFVLILVGYLRG